MRHISKARRKWQQSKAISRVLIPRGETLLQIESEADRDDDLAVFSHDDYYLVISVWEEEKAGTVARLEVYTDDGELMDIVEAEVCDYYAPDKELAWLLWEEWEAL